jgi:hypothetical protein
MSTESEKKHGLTGNQNAAKPKRLKKNETRSFRFTDAELVAYNRAAKAVPKVNGQHMPLRIWLRTTLNEKVGLPPPPWED